MVVRLQKGRRSADVFALLKSFGRAFSKARAGGGGVASSPSQRRNSLAAFLFAKLFLCACGVKEKAGGR